MKKNRKIRKKIKKYVVHFVNNISKNKEKKSEPYDINMILNKKGDKEDSEENDK